MNYRTIYSLVFRNRLPRNVDKYMSGLGKIIFAEKADRQMKLLDLDMDYFMENIAIGITESREERLISKTRQESLAYWKKSEKGNWTARIRIGEHSFTIVKSKFGGEKI